MTTVQSEVYEALRAVDIPEDKALKTAIVLSKRYDDAPPMRDADLSSYNDDVAKLKRDTTVLKWMLGLLLALQIAIFLKVLMP
jgi:hypothetical protein